MKHLLSILCLFVLSCDSDGDGFCANENACNYGENDECYYFFPYDLVDDGDEYYCGDLQVLQDIIDFNPSLNGITLLELVTNDDLGNTMIVFTGGRLRVLDIQELNLTIIPESIGDLNYLEILEIDHNQVTSIPESIGNLDLLRSLALSNNLLSNIPESIMNLNQLQTLDLHSNQFTEIPEILNSLNNLTRLDIGDNQITEMPVFFEDLSNIIDLFFYDNQIALIPEYICNFNNLEIFNIRNNQLNSLPQCICNLPEDCSISVSGNSLCEDNHYDCINNWYSQDQSNCCEGVNDDGETVDNWTTCP